MAKYMLFLHETPDAFENVSPAEMQAIIERYAAWGRKLAGSGRRVGEDKLQDGTVRHMRKTDGRLVVTDGPFVESKEIIGGYWIIQADSYQQAVEIASDCPHLDYGRIEVREIEEMGPAD